MNEVERLARECAQLLDDARGLISRIPNEAYGSASLEWGGGLGMQLRHCLDCFECLFRGLPSGRVDYDGRERDPRIEADIDHGRDQLAEVARVLREEVAKSADRDLEVRMDEPGSSDATGWARSSTLRELRFLASHTVHHFALISLILGRCGIEVDPAFGLAPATAHFIAGRGRRDVDR